MQRRRTTWLAGGIGFIACGVVEIARHAVLGSGASIVFAFISQVLWAVAILVFAIGFSREGSAVARRPLGVAALAIVALWPLIETIVNIATPMTDIDQVSGWVAWTYVSLLLPVAAGLIGTVQIARSGNVPTPWNWAPLWVLAAQIVLEVATLATAGAASTSVDNSDTFATLTALESVSLLIGSLGLGILAIVLGMRTRSSVEVFRSGPDGR